MIERDYHRDFLVRAMRTGGSTLAEIAAEFGVSVERARQLCDRMGVEGSVHLDPVKVIRRLRDDESIMSWETWADTVGHTSRSLQDMTTALKMRKEIDALLVTRRAGRRRGRLDVYRQRLVEDVKALAALLGRSPRSREFVEHYGRHPQFQRLFGNWNICLTQAGLDPVGVGGSGHLSQVAA